VRTCASRICCCFHMPLPALYKCSTLQVVCLQGRDGASAKLRLSGENSAENWPPAPHEKGGGHGRTLGTELLAGRREQGTNKQTNKQGMARQARRPCRGGQQGGSRTALGFYSGCVCIQYWTWVAAGTAAGPSKRSFPDRRAAPAAAAEQPPRA